MPKHPAVITLIEQFKSLQQSARSAADIARWIRERPALFRDASLAVGHTAGEWWYSRPARIFQFDADPFDGIVTNLGSKPFLDALSRPCQVLSFCAYKSDQTINFMRVFDEIPELGLHFDFGFAQEESGVANENQLYVLPTVWPIAASAMLFHANRDDPVFVEHKRHLLATLFPETAYDMFLALSNGDLFSNEAELCEWLLQNKSPQHVPIETSYLPTDLI